MINFLTKKFFDIGLDIYQEIINNIEQNKFIEVIKTIFSTKKISSIIKEITLEKLYFNLIEIDNKKELIKSFKFFVDFIILPNELLEYLISFLENNIEHQDHELYSEIIFSI